MPDGADGIRFPHATPPEPGTAVTVAPGILWLRLPLPMRLDHVNVYALDDGRAGWTLIDSGIDWDRGRAALQAALDGPLAGRPVWRVIVTHHHPDHVGLAGWLAARQGAAVWMHRTGWLLARMLQKDEQDRPPPETLAFWRAGGMAPDLLAERAASRPFNFADATYPLALGFTRMTEAAPVHAAGRDWRVVLGQGHAPDHVTLWSEADDIVIAGDQVLPGISSVLSLTPTEPGADPVGEWLASCRRLRALARPGHLVLPGHKLPFFGLEARLDQLIDHHVRALDRLEAALDAPRAAGGCFVPLFGREITGSVYGFALSEAMAHLAHLARTGRAEVVGTSPEGAVLYRRTNRSGARPHENATPSGRPLR